MKKVLLGSIATVLAFTACISSADAAGVKPEPCGIGPYVAVKAGYSLIKNHIDKGTWNAGLAVGTKMDSFRTELEYMYRGEIKGRYLGEENKIQAQTLLVNGYYDIATNSALTPYVGLSIGTSRLHEKRPVHSKNTFKFAWGGGAGVAYHMTQKVALDLGYRFLDMGDSIKSNEFIAGVRYNF